MSRKEKSSDNRFVQIIRLITALITVINTISILIKTLIEY